jgi:TRAP-type C4-dicarboxylate transport system substrate-binding protein
MENIALEEMNEAADSGTITAGESTYVRVFPLEQYKSFSVVNDTAHSLFLTSIIANQDFMATLTAEEQKAFSDAAFVAARQERRESVADIPNILAECQARGVKVVKMSVEAEQEFRDTTAPVYEMYKDYFTAGLVSKIQKQ